MFFRYLLVALVALVPVISAFIPRFNFMNGIQQLHSIQQPQSKFSFFNKFVPKVYYYQVQQSTTTVTPPSPLEICTTKGGFYVNGMCYVYFDVSVDQATAITNCASTDTTVGTGPGSTLWIPNINDFDLCEKVIEAQPGELFASSNQEVWVNLINCENAGPPVVSYTDNYLCKSVVENADGDCNVLKWTTGGCFYIAETDCDNQIQYVCKVPI